MKMQFVEATAALRQPAQFPLPRRAPRPDLLIRDSTSETGDTIATTLCDLISHLSETSLENFPG
jgi:hypothetical protein